LDEFKTQVLILHSEQSTLDNLSSGFGDRYTVHCATSGSEALNTLVETPINVIITAHDLPGMSGLDALREAKKRSPDTIGILLAGSKTSDIEALVGEEEVFQVVSGAVTSDGLLKLVDNATRQMRLMALAESANDTTSGVDMSAEHIVMETSENGSTIISDGTGRMPVLDPKKIAAAVSVGSRSVDILVLTKDQEFLATIKDSSRSMHKVYYANTLGQANEAIRKHKIGVAVVDAAMVGEKIEQLTQHLRKGSPRLVSIVAGRRNDGEMLMDLINRGKVYRFLLKPVSPGRARLAVESSVKHHLEAPDAAFKSKGLPAVPKPMAIKPAPKPVAKPAPKPKPVAKAAPKPVVRRAPKPVAKPAPKPAPAAAEVAATADPPFGSAVAPQGGSPLEDGLADAFGQDNSSFTETMTGLISSVSKKFSSDKKAEPGMDLAIDGLPSRSDGSLFRDPKMMGLAAAAVVVVASALFWFMTGSDAPQAISPEGTSGTPSIVETDSVLDEAPLAEATVDVGAIVAEARLARDAGQIFNPAGNNAIELFASALTTDPDNSNIAAELDAVIGQALGLAESAMLESRLDDSDAALQRIAAVDPQNLRLPFLTAQLAQMQLRGRLDAARVAIRESRFEDAAAELNAARNLGVSDTTEIVAVTVELGAARNEQQVDGVLAKAADRLDAGDLLSPANDNARYYYELVLSNDAENTAARQGLSAIAGKLAFQARSEIDSGDLNAAENILADAHALDSANSDVASTVTALANARAALVEQQRRAEAERQAAADRRAADERDAAIALQAEADRQAAAEIKAEADRQAAAIKAEADRQAEGERLAAEAEAKAAAIAENEVVAAKPAVEQPAQQLSVSEPAQAEPTLNKQPAAVSSLDRVKYVAPKYPRAAQRRNQSGWVDVVFIVTTDGSVRSVDVRDSEPGDTFDNAAIKAVEKWRFEPVIENGMVIEKLVGVRMMFALE
jgi:serine/threonine-protein kinase